MKRRKTGSTVGQSRFLNWKVNRLLCTKFGSCVINKTFVIAIQHAIFVLKRHPFTYGARKYCVCMKTPYLVLPTSEICRYRAKEDVVAHEKGVAICAVVIVESPKIKTSRTKCMFQQGDTVDQRFVLAHYTKNAFPNKLLYINLTRSFCYPI